jgi:hypothetical protein
MGPNENEFVALHPLDGSADEDGSFPCGREQAPLEGKEFRFPKNFTCDDCSLQLEWRTNSRDQSVQFHHCGDIDVMEAENLECLGQCKNGGACINGECKCRRGYHGSTCQIVEGENVSTAMKIFYSLVFLTLVILIGGFIYSATKKASRRPNFPGNPDQFDDGGIIGDKPEPERPSGFNQQNIRN